MMNRSKILLCVIMVFGIVGLVGSAQADLTFTVRPSSAPNAFGSPSWATYAANALNSLGNGLGNIGDRNTDPTAYEIAGAYIEPGDVTVSGFSSWRGVAGPASPFTAEYGNRMHFGLSIVGGGTNPQFRLNDLAFNMASGDSANSLVFSGNFAGLGYNANRYGVDFGADRVLGGGDDIVYTAGNGMSLVDKIVYVGVGNAFDATFEPGTDQDKIDSVASYINSEGPFGIACTYTLYSPNGDELGGSGAMVIVPSPGLASLALAAGTIGLTTRRRRAA